MTYDVQLTTDFRTWLGSLTDGLGRRAIATRLTRISSGLLGDTKSLGDGISEVRVDVGPGYRLYYTLRGRTVVFMLTGGDKSSQPRDIKMARKLAEGIP